MMHKKGQSLIEILLAIGLSVIVLPALFLGFMAGRSGKEQQNQHLVAVPLLTEGQEAIKSLKERSWTTLASYQNSTVYHPVINNHYWLLQEGEETINGFSRQIVLEPVFRNLDGQIVEESGVLDPSSRKAIITVSWQSPQPGSISSTLILTRHENLALVHTTVADFGSGTQEAVTITNDNDGEVVLGSTGGYGDWCNPSLSYSAFDLPKSGVANAISAIEGQIATGTGNNASGVSYANILINDPAYPTSPSPSLSGTYDGYKTNDVFVEQDYAYLATDDHVKEVVIIDLNQQDAYGKYSQVGYMNIPGNVVGNNVLVINNIGYATYGNKLYSFDLSNKNGERPLLDSDGITLPGTIVEILVVGSRAFVANSSTTNQLTIINISSPNNLTIVDQISVNGAGGKALFVNRTGTRAYLATAVSNTQRELFIIDIDPLSTQYKQTLSVYDTNGMNPTGITTVSGPRAIIVGTGTQEYQVVDITQEVLPQGSQLPQCGQMNIDSGIYGVASVFTTANRAYSYIITGDSTAELKIIEGGPGASGSSYTLSGIYTSTIIDFQNYTSNIPVTINRFSADVYLPSSVTTLRAQIATASPVNNSCQQANFSFVGPDLTSNAYFLPDENNQFNHALPIVNSANYQNPSRCLQYRFYFTTQDETLTPIINSVGFNYSP